MRLFVSKWECSGCRACEQICPRKCIHMEYDTEGFMYPEIDEQSCVQCGLCQKICKDQGNAVSDALHLNYAAYNKNREIRSHSSSGGVFYELGREVIERGDSVYSKKRSNYIYARRSFAGTSHRIFTFIP